jgi:nucleotide-binding universal stress UspA family protein
VLFPTDFSENADHAFAYVEKLAAEGARRVTLLHVQGRARIDPYLMHRLEEFDQIDLARPEEMRKRLPKAGGAEGKAAAPEFAGRRGRLADWYMRMEGAAAGEAVNETYSWLVFDAKGRLDLPAAHAIEADALPSERERERIQVLVSGAGGTVGTVKKIVSEQVSG